MYKSIYFQGRNKYCVTFSVASVLHYVGLQRQARELVRVSTRLNEDWNNWEMSKKLIMGKGITIKNSKIDSITDIDFNTITVLCLCAVHVDHYSELQFRDSTHVVTAYQNQLFDANKQKPLKLVTQNLHLCCIGDKWKFHHFSRSFIIKFDERLERIIHKNTQNI